MDNPFAQRRDLLLAPLLAAFPLALAGTACAEALNPGHTMFTPPDKLKWDIRPSWPRDSVASVDLAGNLNRPGLYYTLIKWFPGYMSAPHRYVTDRLCVVVSGTWWINSGEDFDPANCVPVPAGTFVHRIAHTPHYDGVIATGPEPAVIAICGMGPVELTYVDADKPGWRKV